MTSDSTWDEGTGNVATFAVSALTPVILALWVNQAERPFPYSILYTVKKYWQKVLLIYFGFIALFLSHVHTLRTLF